LLGTAKHEALAYIPQGLAAPTEEIAAKHAVAQDDIDIAVRIGERAWREVGVYMPDAEVERKVISSVCRGTADVASVLMRDGVCQSISLADWKTGWGDNEHPNQLKGYALCLVEEFGFPRKGAVSVFEIWTSHQQIRTTNLTEDELLAFRETMLGIIDKAERSPGELEYRAGSHCLYCQHKAGCPTRQAWMRSAVTALVGVDKTSITRDDIGAAYMRFVEVDRACRQFESLVKAALEDGPIPLPDGRRVEYVESKREKIGAAGAIKALADRLDDNERAELLGDISKSALDNWAKAHSAKGKKAALLREVMAEIKSAGAVRSVPHRQRKIVDRGER